MTTRRILVLLAAVSFLAMWGVSIACYGPLPMRFPSHFDAAGVADGFMEKSVLGWFALPIVFSVLSAFFMGIGSSLPAFSARYPGLVNVPNKDAFVALPEAARARVLAPMQDMMLLMIVPLAGLSAYIAYGSFELATSARTTLSPFPVAIVIGFILVSLVVATVRTSRAIDAETKHAA